VEIKILLNILKDPLFFLYKFLFLKEVAYHLKTLTFLQNNVDGIGAVKILQNVKIFSFELNI